MSKNGMRLVLEEYARLWNSEEGMKSVHVKDPSKLAMAMNIKSFPGQICRWFGSIRNLDSGSSPGRTSFGSMWNSHQRVSMYSCW